ncbi:MAG TPA: holo-ACP synthase [Chitinophagaceae bacterium]|nr:holo-ACP synthase [Chitinophagaceae bacterium]
MIIGIGCDVVDHNITKLIGWETDSELLERFLSQSELEQFQINKTIKFLASRYAVKEAVLKSLGTGMQDGISLKDIEVLQSEEGKPGIKLNGEVKRISDELGIKSWYVTITHTKSYSLAFVIAEM